MMHERYEQGFKVGLRSLYLADLEEARQSLAHAQGLGLTNEEIRKYTMDALWIPCALEHMGDVAVDGSARGFLAIPERTTPHE